MSDYESLRAETRRLAPWLAPVIGTYSALGSTTTGIDTFYFQDANTNLQTPEDLAGYWILRPDAAVAGDRERQIDTVALATGTITHRGAAYTNAPASAEQYEIWLRRPKDAFDELVSVMENFQVPTYQALPAFTDADQETSGVGSWTASAASLTKVTTAANVPAGNTQSLRTLLTGAGYAESVTFVVVPGQTYRISVPCRVDVGGPAILVAWDKTNDAEIESSLRVSHSLERFMVLMRSFTTPSTCKLAAVRLQGTANLDDIYWGAVHGPWLATDDNFNAPSWLNRASDLRKLMTARYTLSYDEGVYDAASRVFNQEFYPGRDYALRSAPAQANPYRIEMTERARHRWANDERWVEALRPAADLYTLAFTAAGETAPAMNIDKRFLSLEWVAAQCQAALAQGKQADQAGATLKRIAPELDGLRQNYLSDLQTPVIRDDVGLYRMTGF